MTYETVTFLTSVLKTEILYVVADIITMDINEQYINLFCNCY